eukprot:GFUD01044753.1.p1 GENE.GFUD01044753.1~~GFUD01044753.1.p1  ORF type:complete len:764 (-),score=201.74 GFUD01044753.1:241-2532(-)
MNALSLGLLALLTHLSSAYWLGYQPYTTSSPLVTESSSTFPKPLPFSRPTTHFYGHRTISSSEIYSPRRESSATVERPEMYSPTQPTAPPTTAKPVPVVEHRPAEDTDTGSYAYTTIPYIPTINTYPVEVTVDEDTETSTEAPYIVSTAEANITTKLSPIPYIVSTMYSVVPPGNPASITTTGVPTNSGTTEATASIAKPYIVSTMYPVIPPGNLVSLDTGDEQTNSVTTEDTASTITIPYIVSTMYPVIPPGHSASRTTDGEATNSGTNEDTASIITKPYIVSTMYPVIPPGNRASRTTDDEATNSGTNEDTASIITIVTTMNPVPQSFPESSIEDAQQASPDSTSEVATLSEVDREPRVNPSSFYDLFGYSSFTKTPQPDSRNTGADVRSTKYLDISTTKDSEFVDFSSSTDSGDFPTISAATEVFTMPLPSAKDIRIISDEDTRPASSLPYDAQSSLYRMFDFKSYDQSDSSKYRDQTSRDGPYCHMEEKVEYEDKCETYKEKTCHTQNREKCHPESVLKCRPVLRSKVEEVCLNVTDESCSLKETEEQLSVEEPYTVDNCYKVMKQVCDQNYEVLVTEKEQEQCVDLETVDCTEESVTVSDSKCTEAVEFNCQQDEYREGVSCVQTPNKCVTIPRQVMVTTCQATTTLCHNLTSQQVVPVMTEVCHDQPTSVCRKVERVRPVIRKNYSYTVSCDKVERESCKLVEKVKLEPSCVTEDRPVCEHHLGDEECREERKLFCYKEKKVVEVKVCDDHFETFEL